MKNVPEVIYLQVGEDVDVDTDFKELREVSWCVDKVFNTDIPFVLHKTPCYTTLELLEQMLNKEQEFSIQVTNYSTRQSVNANINAIRSVMEMIKERQADAV